MSPRARSLVLMAVGLALVAGVLGVIALQLPRPAPTPTPAPSQKADSVPTPPCLLPGPPPAIPDGRVATGHEMRVGHDATQGFVNQLEAYQACLNDWIDHPRPNTTDALKEKWTQEGNEAVDQANALAARFGDQLKIWKARTGESLPAQ